MKKLIMILLATTALVSCEDEPQVIPVERPLIALLLTCGLCDGEIYSNAPVFEGDYGYYSYPPNFPIIYSKEVDSIDMKMWNYRDEPMIVMVLSDEDTVFYERTDQRLDTITYSYRP